MRKTLAVVAAVSIAATSLAAPAQAAQSQASSFHGLGAFVQGLLNFKPIPFPPSPPPPQALIGVCNILKVDWLIKACRAGFPGGGMSPG